MKVRVVFLFSVLCLASAVGGRAIGAPAGRAELAAKLLASEGLGTPEKLLAETVYRDGLLAHELLRRTGDEALAKLRESDPDFPAFLENLLGQPDWLVSYLNSGRPIEGTPDGLAVLLEIWKAEGRSTGFQDQRELACALANQWSVGRNAGHFREKRNEPRFSTDPVTRFRLFRKLYKEGRLHPMFAGLKSWEMGFVVGQQWSDEALAWLNKNCNLPLERYPDACWAVEYKGTSDFGDTVQGPMYMRPWSDEMNEAENTLRHGSVCGGLSTYGVAAAAAHGIPAYTVGQPGHCAMGVRFARGDWRGGFGGPDGGPHLYVWEGNIHYIELMEAVFGDDAGLEKALLHQCRARLFESAGNVAAALEALKPALAASPLHLDLRRLEIELMAALQTQPAGWMAHVESLLRAFAAHPHPGVDLCREIEPRFIGSLDEGRRLAWFACLQRAAATATDSWAWKIPEQVLIPQAKLLDDAAARDGLLREALSAHLGGANRYFGQVLEWGVKEWVEKGRADAFGSAFSAAIAANPDAKPDEKRMAEAYHGAIIAVEKSRSIPAFHALSKAGAPYAPEPPGAVELDLPPGRIISTGGVIYASSSAWDKPLSHFSVLGVGGGAIHTGDETNPTITVELPAAAEIGGVLLVKSAGNQHRMKRARISRSTDGATWFPIAETDDMPAQWKVVTPPATSARWIKFEALNDHKEFCHLRNFIVTAS